MEEARPQPPAHDQLLRTRELLGDALIGFAVVVAEAGGAMWARFREAI